jgi:hypothetical protein
MRSPRFQKGASIVKNIYKSLLLIAILIAPAASVFAAEGPTKGTKSYQSAKAQADEAPAQTQTMKAENTQKPQDIAPAAGGLEEDAGQKAGKAFMEEIRLPRKN